MSEGPRGAREAEHESLGDLAYLRIQCQALHLPLKEGTKSERVLDFLFRIYISGTKGTF